ncbi:hypothetical protein [Sediminimonas sp.]|uniref:hypothetical protein n=1 Tax=Sediminimonas sp. TaxID=2823379 RepID=UPI0025EAAA5E|nr:hypothetical protein [Sediminimonas sp.]
MDEVKVQKTPETTHTTINRTEAKPSGGGSVLWFSLGAIVVVVAIIAYFVFGDGMWGSRTSGSSGGNLSINVETNDAPASESEPAPATGDAPAEATTEQQSQD